MKLFNVVYFEGDEHEQYLTVGESEEQVKNREQDKLAKEDLLYLFVNEIKEVDGHKIIVGSKL